LIGYQTLLSGIYIAAFGKAYGVGGEGRLAKSLTSYHSLERELIVGTTLLSAGVILGLKVILTWMEAGYGSLQEMQESVMAMVLTIMGIQTAFSAIFISLLLLNSDEGREG